MTFQRSLLFNKYFVDSFIFVVLQEKRSEGMETKKKMEAEMIEAGEIIKARKEEKLSRMTSGSRYL